MRRALLVWVLACACACGGGGTGGSGSPTPGETPDAGMPPTVAPPSTEKGAVAVAKFDGTHGSGTAPDSEKFDGTGSYSKDPAATIVSCGWTFGDGATANGCKTAHTFASAGKFTVTLTVTDSDGSQDQGSLAVTVSAPGSTPPPTSPHVTAVAKFDGTDGSGVAPDTEKFDGTSSTSSDPKATVSCDWAFGDGATASGCKATHTFAKAGTFTVTLTAHDSNGTSDTASLNVKVTAPSNGIRWMRSGIGGSVGSDFSSAAVEASGGTLERFDPVDGHTIWTAHFGDPQEGKPYSFQHRLFIGPNGGPIFATHNEGEPPFHSADACAYALADGTQQGCFDGESLENGVVQAEMGGGGEVASAHIGHDFQSVLVRRTDGSTWSATLEQSQPGSSGPTVWLDAVTAEPGGDAVVEMRTRGGASYQGQVFPDGAVLLRIHDDGSLVWWRPLGFEVWAMSTSSAGTVTMVGAASTPFTWGGQQKPPGNYLATITADSSERWLRALPGLSTQLAVLPAGQVAISIFLSDGCKGSEVRRYNLAGDLLWSHAFPEMKCDAMFGAVAILPDDVIVSGSTSGTVTINSRTFSNEGFLVDLSGH